MMHHLKLLVFGLGAILQLASSALGGQDLHPGIIGDDDRVRIQRDGPPWDAIGQVNVSTYRMIGQCTGTLVAPDVVITAAHCLMDPWKSKPYPLRNIHFVAGVRGSSNKGHATAKCLRFSAGSEFTPRKEIDAALPAKAVPVEVLHMDAVAIVLNEQLSVEPAPFADSLIAAAGLDLVNAAYPADHRFSLMAQFKCQLGRTDREGRLWLNNCDTHPASSGGPLFVEMDGKLKLAAIVVASGQREANFCSSHLTMARPCARQRLSVTQRIDTGRTGCSLTRA